ncbi:hypothetical protein DL240_03975 [Lujinxingia litoralis]|uniref:Uncharacterized protein n=1 Tax=Lujinxingia litoralis TaxID=2211119 RepID=A0A328CCE1_9DELT|nr:hypothetical protein [Lujinxingia litoralis]RAL25376.1 hypothetical protein DL240_03975 [Lujinxingia litoralis]
MAKLSKQTAYRLAIKENVRSSVRSHRETLAAAVERKLFGKEAPGPLTVAELIDALTRSLDAKYAAFVALEQELAVERSQDARARGGRDEAMEGLRQALIRVRGVIEGFWGAPAVAHAGFIGVTPQVVHDLVMYAKNVDAQLGQGLDAFEPQLPMSPPDVQEMRELIRGQVAALEAALATMGTEERETQDLQNRRDQAAEAWDKTYIPVANIVEHLFRLADMPAWADQVRPTARRRAGLAEAADLEALDGEVEIEGGDPVSEEEPAPLAE